jgi:serine protease Do
MSKSTRTTVALLVLMAFAAGAFTVTAGADWLGLTNAFSQGHADPREGGTRIDSEFDSLDDAFVEVAERVNPTVVQISATRTVAQRGGQARNPFEGTPFEDFFGGGGPQLPPGAAPQRSGLGSGVIIRPDGYILTNDHVVSGSDDLRVTLFSGEEYSAELIGTDPSSDLAIIRIDRTALPFVSFGSVDDIRVGQWAVAFGSPLDAELSNTVTAGIVSAIGRYDDNAPRLRGSGGVQLQGYIQTDAAINPGNSGGPLVNLRAELIGLNNAIYTRTGGYQGIGFAIPVDAIRNVADQLIETGTVRRAYLGIGLGGISQSLARALDVPVGSAQVGNVQPGTAADRAGLQAGDLITAIDGVALRDFREVTRRILNKRPGERVELSVVRGEERLTVPVELGERDLEGGAPAEPSREDEPEAETEPAGAEARFEDELGFDYADVADVPPALARRLFGDNVPRSGVVVTDVDRQSDAFRDAGIQPGLLIASVNGREVDSMREFERAYERIDAGETFFVTLAFVQGDGTRNVTRTALTKPR